MHAIEYFKKSEIHLHSQQLAKMDNYLGSLKFCLMILDVF